MAMAVLVGESNPFNGIHVGPDKLPEDPDAFAETLASSIQQWRSDGLRVVWLQIPIAAAALVPVAVAAGFVYHHATEQWLQLTLTLREGSYVPPFATHYIGAGGVVLDADRNLLVIQERHHRRPHLKLPGGALHPGEHIADAVVREVKEETGIDTRYLSLVCFRHWHGYRHGKSDIYFVSRLEPLNHEIQLDPSEIAECRWMPVEEYLAHEHTHQFNRRIVQAALEGEQGSGELRRQQLNEYGTPQTHEIFMPGAAVNEQGETYG